MIFLQMETAHYTNFISQSTYHDDALNADTEMPTEEALQIAAIEDLEARTELQWVKYLRRLREGAWSDHLTIQALANMLGHRYNFHS